MNSLSHPLRTAAMLFATAVPALSQLAAPLSDIYRSVLRIEVATQTPDYGTPWNSGRFSGGIGTGFIIGPNQILTNAHVVSNGSRVLVTTSGSPQKYPAKVTHIAHDCDLALLTLDDFSDFEHFPVFEIGPIPSLESEVRVIGYPVGGERISVTRGVVSRIDFNPYSHSRADSHLVIQIDAAINPGNSGGPVVQDGKVVGVAFQGLREADNTGFIIPTPVVERFLEDIKDGQYDHYVDFAAEEFPLFNPAMRKALGLPNDNRGVLITRVTPTGSADGVLESGDILLGIDGLDVDSAGMVELNGEKVNYHEVIERKFAGDLVPVQFRRGGETLEKEIELKPLPWSRMYAIQYEKKPRYVVFAGLVFQPLDTNLFATRKFEDVTVRRLFTDYVSKGLFQERKDIVILTRVESDPVTSRLDEFAGFAVDKVNGEPVRDLAHLNSLLYPESEAPEFFVIDLFGAPRPLVIRSADIAAANSRVSAAYNIRTLSNLED